MGVGLASTRQARPLSLLKSGTVVMCVLEKAGKPDGLASSRNDEAGGVKHSQGTGHSKIEIRYAAPQPVPVRCPRWVTAPFDIPSLRPR